ncbi:DUF1934 domain-containing protein [Pontibacillus litoralis]|uniref:DUF1934 domain-containing protein n=1 Tax=Pontibacillus litoralis JSM 072002 TaxID=1385512 RepID=A0A0A5G5Q9_9BACI|nr:DUF1934 domain-containing protein [Pontibacillus litoralis]KGX86483.1 hypothetical protein N784_04830 [Pontibacillus litoralis JSM 072002]
MSDERIPIKVRLVTEMKDREDKQKVVVEETGDYIRKGNTSVIRYTEHHEEEQPIDNMVTIKPDKVIVRRTGPVHMNQIFQVEQVTENIYHHPYGNFHMLTTTKSIHLEQSDAPIKGMLKMVYDLEMNGQVKQRHRFSLRFQEVN